MFKKKAQSAAFVEPQAETLFLQRYDRMLEWAMHLTDHRAGQAEDLVHDTFVQLTMTPPDFTTIENLDGYLFVVMRNLYRSQMQRAMRGPLGPEALVEYDSAEAGLRAVDPARRWQAMEELREVCRYACDRKESSKASSALILRFFHGYYPGEIAALFCISRPAVKELLRMARGEAKLFLQDPAKLGLMKDSPTGKASRWESADSRDETRMQFQQAIFASRKGRCLPSRHLAEIYEAARPELLTPSLLAHLVSCPQCLEEANRLLQLPRLSDRDPNDMLGPDRSEGAGGKSGPIRSGRQNGAQRKALANYRRRLREVYEHEPRELRIAVNGFVLARQEVIAPVHQQTLGIEVAEDLTLIEVFSEQGVRMLALHVEPPPIGKFEQAARAEFSDGRTLHAALSFCGSWPHLEVTYDWRGVTEQELPSVFRGVLFPSEADAPAKPKGPVARFKAAMRHPQIAILRLLRPATITSVLALFLVTAAVGQRLGWWLAPQTQVNTGPRATPSAKPGGEAGPRSTPPHGIVAPAPAREPAATISVEATAIAEVEIEALRLLGQAGGDLGEQIEVRRTDQGTLRIEGIVESDARKTEILQALAPLAEHSAVSLQVETVAEALARQRKTGPSQSLTDNVSHVEVERSALPIARDLRTYLQFRGSDPTEAAVHELSANLHNQAHRAFDHLYALQRLTRQIPNAKFHQLTPKAQTQFRTLLAGHARGYAGKARRLREELQNILNVSPPTAMAERDIQNVSELYSATARLFALGKSADAVIDDSLTISNRASTAVGIKSSSFWQTLIYAEALAATIERFAGDIPKSEK